MSGRGAARVSGKGEARWDEMGWSVGCERAISGGRVRLTGDGKRRDGCVGVCVCVCVCVSVGE